MKISPDNFTAMNRAERRAAARSQHRAHRPGRRGVDGSNIRLSAQPWKIHAVFAPLEQLLAQIELTGCVDECQGRAVFMEHGAGGYYELAPAIRGIVDFHDLAASRHGVPLDTRPLTTLANKIEYDTPLVENDLARARDCINRLKSFATRLTAGEAKQLLADSRRAGADEPTSRSAT